MKIGYAFKRVFKMDLGRVVKDVERVSKKSGKNQIHTMFDMLACALKYGAGPLDYELFEFYNKNAKQRSTYITRAVNNALVKKYNQSEYRYIFDKKNEFNKTFKDFINRDWLLNSEMTKEQFEDFIKDKDKIIYKPINGICGRGVEIYNVSDVTFEQLVQMPEGMIEQVITQHPALSEVYPKAINTIRIVTITQNKIATPLFACWRIGNHGKFVDNLNAGGMAAKLDIKTGKIISPAADKKGLQYTVHPETQKQILGFKMPMWNEVLYTVCNAAKCIPQICYVGWDVAISPDSVQLIEGNEFPGHDILQLPVYTPDNIGLKPLVEKYL